MNVFGATTADARRQLVLPGLVSRLLTVAVAALSEVLLLACPASGVFTLWQSAKTAGAPGAAAERETSPETSASDDVEHASSDDDHGTAPWPVTFVARSRSACDRCRSLPFGRDSPRASPPSAPAAGADSERRARQALLAALQKRKREIERRQGGRSDDTAGTEQKAIHDRVSSVALVC
jgi:hypothetical protein